MADNLCGPSTALKSFSEHVNRDRSVHQDRAAPGRAGPSNFRSAPNGTHSNEAEARAFAAGAAAFQAEPMMGPGPDMNGHVHPAAFQQMGPHAHHPQARFAGPGGVVPVHANASNWAAEFASSPSAAHAGATTAAPPAARAAYAPQQPLQAVNRLQHFSSGMMAPGPAFLSSMNQPSFANPNAFAFAGSSQPLSFSNYPASTSYTPPLASTTSAATATMPHIPSSTFLSGNAPSGVAGLTEAELEARFAQVESNSDFQDEMDSWMRAHGPTAEERGEVAAAQTEDVDAILESLADELDAQRLAESEEAAADAVTAEETAAAEAEQAEQNLARDQDDLARTAGQIVNTLDAHPSARFQESSFMRLMRRIHTREVTVQGDNLVDEATGMPIEPVTTSTTSTQETQGAAGGPSETPDQATA